MNLMYNNRPCHHEDHQQLILSLIVDEVLLTGLDLLLLVLLNQDDADADADADAEMIVLLILERKPHGQHYYQCILISARMIPLRLARKLLSSLAFYYTLLLSFVGRLFNNDASS